MTETPVTPQPSAAAFCSSHPALIHRWPRSSGFSVCLACTRDTFVGFGRCILHHPKAVWLDVAPTVEVALAYQASFSFSGPC